MRLVLPLLLCALSACSTSAAPPADPAAVIAAERSFAERGQEVGWIAAFREFTAPDGQIAQAEIVSAPETLADAPDAGRDLFWWPAYAGIARSGDLGFTTGPFSVDETRAPRGQYFTVWRLQPDGSWKWIWDGGPGPRPDALNNGVDAASLPTLPVAAAGTGSAQSARAEVSALEQGATAGTLATRLAADAQVYRPGRPGAGADGFTYPNAEIAYRLTRVEASAAGDLVFTLGEAEWSRDGEARSGFFARIWQYRPQGWRIVYDQLTPRVPPPPPPQN